MPPKISRKRRDLHDGEEEVPADSGAGNSADGEGLAQPRSEAASRLLSELPGSAALTPEPQQERDSLDGTVRAHDQEQSFQDYADAAQPEDEVKGDAAQDVSIEEMELDLKIMARQLEMDQLRKTILQKKRQASVRVATPPPRSEGPVPPPRGPAQPDLNVYGTPVPDTESVLRERQNERLRRAGLLPPRAGEERASAARPSVPVPTARLTSVPPPTPLLNGVDRKIIEIMNATSRTSRVIVGDKSAISKAGIKVAGPDKWKGDRSLQTFADWVHSVAHFFKVHAPLPEDLKVDLIGGYLSGDPLDWYWRHIAPTAEQWTATDVMVALRRQFLVDELSRQAADKFELAEQGSKDVHAFQATLLKLADHMAEYPSPVAMNRSLLKGLKGNISSAIVANRGIDAEVSSWDEIVSAAMDQERANRYAGTLKSIDAPRIEDTNDQLSGDDEPVQIDRQDTDDKPRPDKDNNSNRPAGPNTPQGSSTPTTSPPGPPFARSTAIVPGIKPTGPKPTDQCRACGAFGHWSSHCPKRLRAAMLNIDDVEDFDD